MLEEEKYNRVLLKDETYEYNWQFNLSKGANIITDIANETKQRLIEIANQIINKIELGFCSIDIVEMKSKKFKVLEINSGVMMKNFINLHPQGKIIAKKIYSKAISEMFK